jgi:hypothetical protein
MENDLPVLAKVLATGAVLTLIWIIFKTMILGG